MNLTQAPTKSQQIINALEAEIISGKMQPGQRLQSVRSIADGFSTSISVVNNALNALEKRGLIRRRPRSGVFVREEKPQPTDLSDSVMMLMPSSGHVFQNLFSLIFDQLNERELIPMLANYSKLLVDSPVAGLQQKVFRMLDSRPRSVIIFGRGYWRNPILEHYPNLNGIFAFELDYPGMIPGSAVLLDYEAASYTMAAHLASCGRKRIMFCLAEPDPSDIPVQGRALHHFNHICNGYERALRDYGLSAYTVFYSKAYGEGINEQILAEIMSSPERPDAIMCSMDFSAVRFIEAAEKLGISVPDDLAITGFFNTPWSENSPVKVTTVNFDLNKMASQITTMAAHPPAENKVVYIKPELIIKNSCGGKK